ncbi:hypothetical protein QR680_012130 [Steinernema hermaphroditum]|uniref:Uncharacterized protein n=1 Tax=Steinernema hermaphroditum TaxID=289476 RepID=A0AA39I111_9BILA|nr:hypothetical protein QR680_012130 [Steinernema hermaphroditum]
MHCDVLIQWRCLKFSIKAIQRGKLLVVMRPFVFLYAVLAIFYIAEGTPFRDEQGLQKKMDEAKLLETTLMEKIAEIRAEMKARRGRIPRSTTIDEKERRLAKYLMRIVAEKRAEMENEVEDSTTAPVVEGVRDILETVKPMTRGSRHVDKLPVVDVVVERITKEESKSQEIVVEKLPTIDIF